MIVAVVALKRLSAAKSRLAAVLTPLERERIMRRMAAQTVQALRDSAMVDEIALVTPERGLAAELAVAAVPDGADLNSALQNGIAWARGRGAGGVLLLPADLPLISAGGIRAFLTQARGAVTIAPMRDGGTGALLLSPPDVLPPRFGPESFKRHVGAAQEAGFHPTVVKVADLSLDLDRPEDLRLLTTDAHA